MVIDNAGAGAVKDSIEFREIRLSWNAAKGIFIKSGKSYAPWIPLKADREALLKAFRQETMLGQDILLQARFCKIKGPWAWVPARPTSADGMNNYEDMAGLMHKVEGQWKLLELRSGQCGPGSPCDDDAVYFQKLKEKHPALPTEILPCH